MITAVLQLTLLATVMIIIYNVIMIASGEQINIPIFAYVLIQTILNGIIVLILRKYLRNFDSEGLSTNEQYKNVEKGIKELESSILKGFATMSFEESKKQFEKQYKEVMSKEPKGYVEQELFPETKVEEVKAEPIVEPVIETVDAVLFEEDTDEAFAQFDYTLEEYASIAKESIAKEMQRDLFFVGDDDFAVDLSKMTVAELKQMCKDNGIGGYSKLNKAELIQVIQAEMESSS